MQIHINSAKYGTHIIVFQFYVSRNKFVLNQILNMWLSKKYANACSSEQYNYV